MRTLEAAAANRFATRWIETFATVVALFLELPSRLFFDVPLEHLSPHYGAVDVAVRIHANAFGA